MPEAGYTVDPRGRDWPGHFTMTPEALTMDWRVQPRALRLWCVLDRQAAGRPVAIDSHAAIGDKLRDPKGIPASPDTVARLVTNLEETGWLTVVRKPGGAGRVGHYVLNHSTPTHPDPAFRTDADRPGTSAPMPEKVRTDADSTSAQMRTHTRAVPSLRNEVKGEGEAPAARTAPPSKPNPSQANTTTAGPQPTYVGRCPAHSNDPNPPACGPCADARRAHQAAAAELDRESHRRRPDTRCPTGEHQNLYPAGSECPGCRIDRLATDQPSHFTPTPGHDRGAALARQALANRSRPATTGPRRKRTYTDDTPAATA